MEEDRNEESDGWNNIDNIFDPCVGMHFDSAQEFAKYCHKYASSEGFQCHKWTCELYEFKGKAYGRRKSWEEPQYYVLKRLRLECGKGGMKKKTDDIAQSHITSL